MNRTFLMIAWMAVAVWSCRDRSQPPAPVADTTAAASDSSSPDSTRYFPVFDFLSNEIEFVDSLPVGLMQYKTAGNKKDSGYIPLQEFHRLADEFLSPEIREPFFKRSFTETPFVDRSNGNATFFYKTADTSFQVKRVDVVTAKGEVYDEVKSLYIEKNIHAGDSFVVKKLYWKPKKNFQLITVKTIKDNKPSTELIKVVWDNRE